MRYKCPSCGYLTLHQQPPGTFELCPVCFWEDDPVQFENPDFEGGANRPSLNKARRNFAEFGACDESDIGKVRKPLQSEPPDFEAEA